MQIKRDCSMVMALLLLGCGLSQGESEGDQPSGATCPTQSSLTYDSFGKSFMSTYCGSCHSSALTGAARNGAPSDHNFDTLDGIRELGVEHIDREAAAGPLHVNAAMPPMGVSPQPTESERRSLGEWLACGLR